MAEQIAVVPENLSDNMDRQTVLAVLQFLKKNKLEVRNVFPFYVNRYDQISI